MEKIRIAFISPDIGVDFGRTKVILNIIKYLSDTSNKYVIYVFTNKESRLEIFNDINIQKEYIPISVEKRTVYNFFLSVIKLTFLVKKYHIQVIHSHHRYSDLISFLVSKFVDVKTISTVHSFAFGQKKWSYLTDQIICVSQAVKNHLLKEFNIDENKINIVYNGIELPRGFEYPQVNNVRRNNFNVICIGRFDYDKGQDILIKAFEEIWKKNKNIKLTLVGEYSRNIIKYKNKNNREIKLSFQKVFQEQIKKFSTHIRIVKSNVTPWKLIADSDLVVVVSRIESFGLVPLEAGVLGKCVLASDTGGLKEIIKDRVNGLLFQNTNVEDLSQKLQILLRNRKLIHILGEQLHKDVVSNFSLRSMGSKYIELYEELLQKS